MLLYTLNLGSFILVFAIYPVAYGVGFTLLGLPIVKWISNFKQQPIVGGLYFNVPNSTESGTHPVTGFYNNILGNLPNPQL